MAGCAVYSAAYMRGSALTVLSPACTLLSAHTVGTSPLPVTKPIQRPKSNQSLAKMQCPVDASRRPRKHFNEDRISNDYRPAAAVDLMPCVRKPAMDL